LLKSVAITYKTGRASSGTEINSEMVYKNIKLTLSALHYKGVAYIVKYWLVKITIENNYG